MADFEHEDTGSEEEEDTSSDEDTEDEGADSDGDESEEEDDADDAASDEEDEDSEDDDTEGDDGKGAKSKKSAKKDEKKDDDEEPQKRPKSVADFVALRRGKAAKKGGDRKAKDQGKDGEDTDDEEEGDGEKPLTTKDLESALTPLMQREEESRVDADISAFIEANPDLKPYAAKARRYALHPNRREIPIKAIFYEVAGDDLLKIGAKRAGKADVKAKKARSGGDSGGRGKEGDGSSVWDLSKEDFEKKQQEVRNGR